MVLTLYQNQNILDPSNIYYVANKAKLPIVETLCFIHSEKEMKFNIGQNLVIIPDKDEISIIIN